MLKFIKISLINIFIFFFLVIFIELIFGSWFDKDHLGPYVREHRMRKTNYELTYENQVYKYIYKRNYYGIRGDDVPLENIKIIMVGGSTTDERYKPIEYTIAELTSSELKKYNIDLKLYNFGIEGQSSRGHAVNIDYWFKRLPNFKPKFIIYYIGVNDQWLDPYYKNKFRDGNILNYNKVTAFYDNFKSRSFTYDLVRKYKHKFINNTNTLPYDFDKSMNSKKFKNVKFLSYDDYILKSDLKVLVAKNQELVDSYIKRVQTLYDKTLEFGSIPIFINQLTGEGYYNEKLASINTALIDYCNLKNFLCIDVSKKLKGKKEYWWDIVHTTPKGSMAISKIIAADLKEIIKSYN